MTISLKQLQSCIPGTKQAAVWLPLVNEFFDKYGINTPQRAAAFFSQSGHESADFNSLTENLHYTRPARIQAVWPKRFPTAASASPYTKNAEKLANKVYSNRMGNGTEASGDGWRFRGRGIFQLTGRNNYTEFGRTVGMTAEQAVAYVATPRGAMHSACWFWQSNSLNAVADRGDQEALCRAVNGGTNGLADRQARYARNLQALQTKTAKAGWFARLFGK